MGIALDKAEMLALFLETLLYGVFFTLFCIMILVLYQRGKAGGAQRRMLIPVGTMILLLATSHLIIDFVRILQAFVFQVPANPIAYYSDISHPLHVAKTACYVTQTLIGDAVIVWRLFVVYNRNWYVVSVPILVLLVNGAAGYYTTWTFTVAHESSSIFTYSHTFVTVFFVFTMAVNAACTAAIAWRIYATRCGLDMPNTLLPVTIAIIESGALYATAVLSLLIAYLAHTNGQYAALDAVSPLIGIVFTLIVLQIHFHIGSKTQISLDGPGDSGNTGARVRQVSTCATAYTTFAMQPVSVHVTEESQIGYPGVPSDKLSDRSTYVTDDIKSKMEV